MLRYEEPASMWIVGGCHAELPLGNVQARTGRVESQALMSLGSGRIGAMRVVGDESVIPGPVFAVARAHLARARALRTQVNTAWNAMRTEDLFDGWVENQDDCVRELWVSFEPDSALQRDADTLMSEFLLSIKAALDAAVLAAANVVCRPIGLVDPDIHRMPLISDPSEFDGLPAEGQLRGLRPDHIRTLRLLQPFTERLEPPSRHRIARDMAHLASGLELVRAWRSNEAAGPLFTAWASRADPVLDKPSDIRTQETVIDPAGPLSRPKRLARFVMQEGQDGAFSGDPNLSFDVILNCEPWPEDPDDNFASRSRGLMVITSHLIEGLERSVRDPYRADLLRALDRLSPPRSAGSWLPVNFENRDEEAETRSAIDDSDRGMATYLNGDGTLVYLRLSPEGRVVGREIAPARDLLDSSRDGASVEAATRAAAGSWGLPDFVLTPQVFKKGSGIRELGDGTILAGPRGISLQVKARGVAGDSRERATKWLLRNAAHGLRQARGTIRSALRNPEVELTNLRGRSVTVRGRSVAWLPVVVLDHPNFPPTGVVPAPDPKGPSVVMMRRDWEFLWDQLRSATAVVDYLHRVADEQPLELGAESNRYLDLAERDARATAAESPEWMTNAGAGQASLPLLPHDPAGSEDPFGHAIFQQVLEDIAKTDFTGEETDRVTLLSQIDRVAVGARAELGRLLLRRLAQCAEAAPGGHRLDHRVMYVDGGSLQVTFSTMSQLTDYHLEAYRTWLLVRRQEFLERSGARGPIYPWTVGVVLTPRANGSRPWDTTTISTCGPPQFDDAELARLVAVFTPNLDTTLT